MWDYLFQALSNYRVTTLCVFFIECFMECRQAILVSGDGQIKRTILISGRRNTDWEELAGDISFFPILLIPILQSNNSPCPGPPP